jgi:hypothetical protein
LVSGATFAPGKVGQAFAFDGVRSHVQVPDNPNLRFTDAMTMEAWLYPTSLGVHHEVISKWDWPYANSQKSYTSSIQSAGQIAFGVCDNGNCSAQPGGASAVVASTTLLPVNQWTHFAATYDGAALRICVNGVFENETPYSNGIFPGSDDLWIGAAVPSGTGGASLRLRGELMSRQSTTGPSQQQRFWRSTMPAALESASHRPSPPSRGAKSAIGARASLSLWLPLVPSLSVTSG